MDFRISQEQKLILETVRDFVRTELMPLEEELQKAELAGRGHMYPGEAKTTELQLKAKELGLWGINTPEEYGGINLGVVMSAMIGELRGKAILGGVRGRPPADVDALAATLVRLGNLSIELADRLVEVDVNPLFVLPDGRGVKAADALVVVRE